MAEPIYKLFIGKFREAWHQLSDEERNDLTAKLDEARRKVGAERPILCDSSWSSDQWLFSGVEKFPSIEAVQNFTATLNELNWSRYCESISVLGTEWGK